MTHTRRWTTRLAALAGGLALSALALASPAGATTAASHDGTPAICSPGQIAITPTISGTPYNHVAVGATSWSFGWQRTEGCDALEYRMHENLIDSLSPSGNQQALRTVDYTLTSSSAMSGTDTMSLLPATDIGGTFYGCEQLDVALRVGHGWQHGWGGLVVAPGARPGCTPPPAKFDPSASITATCTVQSARLDNSRSTASMTFTVSDARTTWSVTVAAGTVSTKTLEVPFGATVTVSAGGRTLATATAPTKAACSATPPTTTPTTRPPHTRPGHGSTTTTIGPVIQTDLVGPAPGRHPWSAAAVVLAVLALGMIAAAEVVRRRLVASRR